MGNQLTVANNNITSITETMLNTKCTANQKITSSGQCDVQIDNCDGFVANCGSNSTQGYACDLDSSIKAVADGVLKTKSDTVAGLGFSTSITEADLRQQLTAILEQSCNPSQVADTLRNAHFVCKNSNKARLNAIINTDQTGTCIVTTLTDMLNKTESDLEAKNKGMELLGGLVIAIIVFGLLIVVAKVVSNDKKSGGRGRK